MLFGRLQSGFSTCLSLKRHMGFSSASPQVPAPQLFPFRVGHLLQESSPPKGCRSGAMRLLFHHGEINKQSTWEGGGAKHYHKQHTAYANVREMCWHIDKPHLCVERLRGDQRCALLSLLLYLQRLPPNICLLFPRSSR